MFGFLGKIPGVKQVGQAVGHIPGMQTMNRAIPGGGMPGVNRPPSPGIGPSQPLMQQAMPQMNINRDPNAAAANMSNEAYAQMRNANPPPMPMKQFPPMMPQMGGGMMGPSSNGMQNMLSYMRGRNTGFAGPRMQQPMMQPQVQQPQ